MKQEAKASVKPQSESLGATRFRNLIKDSWARCENNYGLERYTMPKANVLDSPSTRQLLEENEEFLQISQKECQQLYEQTSKSGSIVALVNSDSVILETFGSPQAEEDFRKSYVVPGAVWSEEHQGTNGMGTSIASNKLVNVHKSDHFFQLYQDLTCISAPIHDHQGEILGALDITTVNPNLSPEEQQYTCDLVQAASNYIEYLYFKNKFRGTTLLHFHPRRESLHRGSEGLIALDSENQIVAANERSLFFLKAEDRESLLGKNVSDIFEVAESSLNYCGHDELNRQSETAVFVRDNGRRYIAQVFNQASHSKKNKTSVVFTSNEKNTMDQEEQNISAFSFERLSGEDPTMIRICDRVKRILDKDISILITGDTGTGKKEFARSIHNYSKLADHPFIYLNCSGLTERELFTELVRSHVAQQIFDKEDRDRTQDFIEEVSFDNTGIPQFRCTVFLDQISDLSPVLQQDLLHILQTGRISTPETAQKIPVDWQIISADCKSLRDIVERDLLRPDLYYRLNGINIKLPAIDEREDKASLIEDVLRVESSDARPPHLSKSANQKLLDYHWPGNFRELKTVLKSAVAMSDGRLIQMSHLPDLRTHRYTETSAVLDESGNGRAKTNFSRVEADLTPVELAERDAVIDALEECHWNLSKTTAVLKISRSTLYRKIKKLNIDLN